MSRDDVARLGDRLTRKLEQVDAELIKFGQGVETASNMPYQYKTSNLPIYGGKGYGILLLRGVGGRAGYYPVCLLLLPLTLVNKVILRFIQVSRFPQVQARGTGICQRRRELYSQTFDELIRQVGELN